VSDIAIGADGYPRNGWRIDCENFDALAEIGDEYRDWQDAVAGLYAAPPELNRRWLRTEHQGQQGACQGECSGEVGEVCFSIANQGKVTQFSPQWHYIESQRFDGLIGKDQGSTLFGGAKVLQQLGCCPEPVWPYTGKYHIESPKGRRACLDAAAPYKVKTVVRLKSYQQIFDWLAGGLGSVWIGRRMGWGGGHATHLAGYTAKKDAKGRNFIDEHNSWGTTWGDKGWAVRSPAEVDSWFTDKYTVVLGASDMTTLNVRPVDFSKESVFKL
jgi:hypothetical protein